MPLIILTGYPSTGKTTRAIEIKKYFEELGKEVHLVDEYKEIVKAGFEKNNFYYDARKEKHIRGLLKSEVFKLITPRNVVIFDGSNYIKGYRYELYCGTKGNHSTQCTVRTVMNKDEAWKLNENRTNSEEKYERHIFDGLIIRYEEPDGKNRWDAPLFHIMSDGKLDLNAINESLFEKKAPPPNMSTQNAPLSSTNYLYDLSKVVNDITKHLIMLVTNGVCTDTAVPGHSKLRINLSKATVPQLISLGKQYITYSKMHSPEIDQVPHLYIQYLKMHVE